MVVWRGNYRARAKLRELSPILNSSMCMDRIISRERFTELVHVMQSVLQYVTEAREMKDENLKGLQTTERLHMMSVTVA